LRDEFDWSRTGEFKKLWHIKLGDIVRPAEELTQAELEKAKEETQGLKPLLRVYMRRSEYVGRPRKRTKA
jgi:Mor family transcriptional regulator